MQKDQNELEIGKHCSVPIVGCIPHREGPEESKILTCVGVGPILADVAILV